MTAVIGWDVGGANTKSTFLRTRGGKIEEIRSASEYFPFWLRDREGLVDVLRKLRNKLAKNAEIDAMGLTMTAELSDVYQRKREGVMEILDRVEETFRKTSVYVLDIDGMLKTVAETRTHPLKAAASNWVAIGWVPARYIKNFLVIDVGSTTTDIVPVIGGEVAAKGKTDLDRLIYGELVYTGILRTNVASAVEKVPVRGKLARVSSELFATMGDVHLILGNISKNDYTTETADGRGKSRRESLARLARVVCADTKEISVGEIVKMANYICNKQIEKIADGIKQVLHRIDTEIVGEILALSAGLGGDPLAREAAKKAGIKNIRNLSEAVGIKCSTTVPSTGVALMVAEKLEGRSIK